MIWNHLKHWAFNLPKEPWRVLPSADNASLTKGFVTLAKTYPALHQIQKSLCAQVSVYDDGASQLIGSVLIVSKHNVLLTTHQIVDEAGLDFPITLCLPNYHSSSEEHLGMKADLMWNDCARDLACARLTKKQSIPNNFEPISWYEGGQYKGAVLFVGLHGDSLRLHASIGKMMAETQETPMDNVKLSAYGMVWGGMSGGGVFTPDGQCLGMITEGDISSVGFTPGRVIRSFCQRKKLRL